MRRVVNLTSTSIWFDKFNSLLLFSFLFILIFGLLILLLTRLKNDIKNKNSKYYSFFYSSLIATPIWLTLLLFSSFLSEVNLQIIFKLISLIISLFIGYVIFNAFYYGEIFALTKNTINSIFWPLTILFWSIIKFFIITPILIIRNRILIPIYNLIIFPLGKIGKKPSVDSLLKEIENKAIYSFKEFETEINKIQSVNYVKDAINIHTKTSIKLKQATESMHLLSDDAIFIPVKYKNQIDFFTNDQIDSLKENGIEQKNKTKNNFSNTWLTFRLKRLLWKNIGVSTRMSVFSNYAIMNLLWLILISSFAILITLIFTNALPLTNTLMTSFLILTIFWFSVENYLNKNSRLYANDKNILKLNLRISEYIIALETLEDRLNGFIIRNKEIVEESANQEYRNEFWQYIVKFGPSIYNNKFHISYLSSNYSSEKFISDEIKEQLLFPYSFEKINLIYPELNKIDYRKACKEIFINDVHSNSLLVDEDISKLSNDYDVSTYSIIKIIEDFKNSKDYKGLKENETKEIKEVFLKNPVLILEKNEDLKHKFNIKGKILEDTIEELFYETNFLKSFKLSFEKRYPNLLKEPLSLRLDSTNDKFNSIAKINNINSSVLQKFIYSLKADRNFVKLQEMAILKLRQDLELFCYISTSNRMIFKDFKFMTKFTNAFENDLIFVRDKLYSENNENFFNGPKTLKEKDKYKILESASKNFKELKIRNKELVRSDD